MITFSHYTNATLIEPHPVTQNGPNARRDKPCGLWVSVDGPDDWAQWCQAEKFDIGANRFSVELDLDRLLTLITEQAIRDFHHRYGLDAWGIDWTRVAAEYAGIVIAPYQWCLRLSDEVGWYYSWDCASGCIWDAAAITSIEPARVEAA